MYYVYILVDPRNNKPFYVGKGKDDRVYTHVKGTSDINKKAKKLIESIKQENLSPLIFFPFNNIEDEGRIPATGKCVGWEIYKIDENDE